LWKGLNAKRITRANLELSDRSVQLHAQTDCLNCHAGHFQPSDWGRIDVEFDENDRALAAHFLDPQPGLLDRLRAWLNW
jgi:hypothetical protein